VSRQPDEHGYLFLPWSTTLLCCVCGFPVTLRWAWRNSRKPDGSLKEVRCMHCINQKCGPRPKAGTPSSETRKRLREEQRRERDRIG
jgi:hypothetical protein